MIPRSVFKCYLNHNSSLAFVPNSQSHPAEFLRADFLLLFIFARFLFVP